MLRSPPRRPTNLRIPASEEQVENITRGIKALIDLCRRKAPRANLVVTAIFPRNDSMAVVPSIRRINENIGRLCDGKTTRFLDVNAKLADTEGVLFDGVAVDKLHLSLKGYQIWADALKPILAELLGPPGSTDMAPPPTGDPSARSSAK